MQWEAERKARFDTEWDAFAAASLPPSIEDVGEWLEWEAYPTRPTGPLPRITPEEAVDLIRRSRVYGRATVMPDAPYAKRGEAQPYDSAGVYLRLRAEVAAARGTYSSRDEMHHHGFELELAKAWARQEARHMRAYDPGRAGATFEAIGEDPRLACDCWLLAGDVEGAQASLAQLPPGASAPAEDTQSLGVPQFDKWINLQRILGRELDMADLSAIVWWGDGKLTPFVRDRRPEFLAFLLGSSPEVLGVNLADSLMETLFGFDSLAWEGWHFGGVWDNGMLDRFLLAYVGQNAEVRGWGAKLGREAENRFRESLGIPAVGEGWVSETALFRAIEAAFGRETTVVHHGKPDGFGLQHLDVWLPEWRIGLEYQGLQHDAPVEFFGGQEAFEATQKRDAEKRRKAKRLGIRLIEVRPGFDFEQVLAEIEKARRAIAKRKAKRQS